MYAKGKKRFEYVKKKKKNIRFFKFQTPLKFHKTKKQKPERPNTKNLPVFPLSNPADQIQSVPEMLPGNTEWHSIPLN